MNYLAFTKQRIQFLRYFYSEAAEPFVETRRKIEAEEPPFEPPYSEDSEPAFLGEWLEAGDALALLGQSIASLLSDRLKLYIEYWVDELRRHAGDQGLADAGIGVPTDPVYKGAFKDGWLTGYRTYCEKLGVIWSESGADLDLLEQLALTRNTAQHPTDITSVRVRQTEMEAERFPVGVFADRFDIAANHSRKGTRFMWPPRVEITAENLALAFDEVEKFCEWLDSQHPMRQPLTRAT
jgi:hypothetical protein